MFCLMFRNARVLMCVLIYCMEYMHSYWLCQRLSYVLYHFSAVSLAIACRVCFVYFRPNKKYKNSPFCTNRRDATPCIPLENLLNLPLNPPLLLCDVSDVFIMYNILCPLSDAEWCDAWFLRLLTPLVIITIISWSPWLSVRHPWLIISDYTQWHVMTTARQRRRPAGGGGAACFVTSTVVVVVVALLQLLLPPCAAKQGITILLAHVCHTACC